MSTDDPANAGESTLAEAAGDSRRPNPEVVAWYVDDAQRLLEDQRRHAESLRVRAGQLAGFAGAVLAVIGGNVNSLVTSLHGPARVAVDVCLIAAMLCLSAAVTIAVRGVLRPRIFAGISAEEIAAYTSEPFLAEKDLWRVHVRALYAIYRTAADGQQAGIATVKAVERSFAAFLAGLGFSLLAIATLFVS